MWAGCGRTTTDRRRSCPPPPHRSRGQKGWFLRAPFGRPSARAAPTPPRRLLRRTWRPMVWALRPLAWAACAVWSAAGAGGQEAATRDRRPPHVDACGSPARAGRSAGHPSTRRTTPAESLLLCSIMNVCFPSQTGGRGRGGCSVAGRLLEREEEGLQEGLAGHAGPTVLQAAGTYWGGHNPHEPDVWGRSGDRGREGAGRGQQESAPDWRSPLHNKNHPAAAPHSPTAG